MVASRRLLDMARIRYRYGASFPPAAPFDHYFYNLHFNGRYYELSVVCKPHEYQLQLRPGDAVLRASVVAV